MEEKRITNRYSIRRVLQLLQMTYKLEGRRLLVSNTIAFSLTLVIMAINHIDIDGGRISIISNMSRSVLPGIQPFMLFGYYIGYFFFIRQMIRSKRGTIYVSVPTTALEKMTHILLLALITYITPFILIQVAAIIEALIFNHALLTSWSTFIFGFGYETPFITPWNYLDEGNLCGLLFIFMILLFGCIRFRNTLFVLLPLIAFLFVLVLLAVFLFEVAVPFINYSSETANSEYTQVITERIYHSTLLILALVYLVRSYYALKVIELR